MLVPIEQLENRWADSNKLLALLPLLEYSYPSILDKLAGSETISPEMLTEVVEFSLKFPSRHWAMCAVIWIENGFVINNTICEILVRISKDKTDSQALRHKAITQANKWKHRNGI